MVYMLITMMPGRKLQIKYQTYYIPINLCLSPVPAKNHSYGTYHAWNALQDRKACGKFSGVNNRRETGGPGRPAQRENMGDTTLPLLVHEGAGKL